MDREKVLKLAMLSRLSLTETEVDLMQKDLDNIFGLLNQLQEIDTEGIEPTYQVSGKNNVLFEDEIVQSETSSEDLLNCSAFPVQDNQIKTNSILS